MSGSSALRRKHLCSVLVRVAQAALILFLALVAGFPAHAAEPASPAKTTLYDTPRFTLYMPNASETESNVPGDTVLEDLARNSLEILNATYDELSELLHVQPKHKVVMRFMTPSDFHKHTHAPAWTSAMFLGGEISIPIPRSKRISVTELTRAIRHEYTHSVVSELSGKGCPAWVDEGVAQLFEGDPNPLLGPALRAWVEQNEALPLSWLQNGFLTLQNDLVPVAYAQSLFATRYLMETKGYPSITEYLSALRAGKPEPEAFKAAFGIDESSFEKQLTAEMRQWAKSGKRHP